MLNQFELDVAKISPREFTAQCSTRAGRTSGSFELVHRLGEARGWGRRGCLGVSWSSVRTPRIARGS